MIELDFDYDELKGPFGTLQFLACHHLTIVTKDFQFVSDQDEQEEKDEKEKDERNQKTIQLLKDSFLLHSSRIDFQQTLEILRIRDVNAYTLLLNFLQSCVTNSVKMTTASFCQSQQAILYGILLWWSSMNI